MECLSPFDLFSEILHLKFKDEEQYKRLPETFRSYFKSSFPIVSSSDLRKVAKGFKEGKQLFSILNEIDLNLNVHEDVNFSELAKNISSYSDYAALFIMHYYLYWIRSFIKDSVFTENYIDLLNTMITILMNTKIEKWQSLIYSSFCHFFAFLIDTVNLKDLSGLFTPLLTKVNFTGTTDKSIELIDKLNTSLISPNSGDLSKTAITFLNFVIMISRTVQNENYRQQLSEILKRIILRLRCSIVMLNTQSLLFLSRTIAYLDNEIAQELTISLPTAIMTHIESYKTATEKVTIDNNQQQSILPFRDTLISLPTDTNEITKYFTNNLTGLDLTTRAFVNVSEPLELIDQSMKEKIEAICKIVNISDNMRKLFIDDIMKKVLPEKAQSEIEKKKDEFNLQNNIRFYDIYSVYLSLLIELSPIVELTDLQIVSIIKLPSLFNEFIANSPGAVYITSQILILILKQREDVIFTAFKEMRRKPIFFSIFLTIIKNLIASNKYEDIFKKSWGSLVLSIIYSIRYYNSIVGASLNEVIHTCFSLIDYIYEKHDETLLNNKEVCQNLITFIFEISSCQFLFNLANKLFIKNEDLMNQDKLLIFVESFNQTLINSVFIPKKYKFDTLTVEIITRMLTFINSYPLLFISLLPYIYRWFDHLNVKIDQKCILLFIKFLISINKNHKISYEESQSLKSAINSIYENGKKTQELRGYLVSLLAGKSLTDEKDYKFSIEQPNILYLFYETEELAFLYDLIKYSPLNAVSAHTVNYDMYLINSLFNHRNGDIELFQQILNIFIEIVKFSSSAGVVQKFFQLFETIDGGFVSKGHKCLLNALLTLIEASRLIPSSLIFNSSIYITGLLENILGEKFSICFWIIAHSYNKDATQTDDSKKLWTTIFELENTMKIVLNENNKFQIILNGEKTGIFDFELSENRWHHVNFSLKNRENKCYWFLSVDGMYTCYQKLDTGLLIKQENKKMIFSASKKVLLGPFGICPYLKKAYIRDFIETGVRKRVTDLKPFIYIIPKTNCSCKPYIDLYRRDISINASYDLLNRFYHISFVDCLIEQCGLANYFLPLFEQTDMNELNSVDNQVLNSIEIFNLTVDAFCGLIKLSENAQNEFTNDDGFGILSVILQRNKNIQNLSFNIYQKFVNLSKEITSTQCKEELINKIILNFDIWIKSEDNLEILSLLSRNVKLFHSSSKTNLFIYLLFILRNYYYYSSDFTQSNTSKLKCINRNPNIKIKESRKILLSTISSVAVITNLPDTMFSYFISDFITMEENENEQRKDMIQMVLRLFTEKEIIITDSSIQVLTCLLKFDEYFLDVIDILSRVCSSIFNRGGSSINDIVHLCLMLLDESDRIPILNSNADLFDLINKYPQFFSLFSLISINDGSIVDFIRKCNNSTMHQDIYSNKLWCYPIILFVYKNYPTNNNEKKGNLSEDNIDIIIESLTNVPIDQWTNVYGVIDLIGRNFSVGTSKEIKKKFINDLSKKVMSVEKAESFLEICQLFLFFKDNDWKQTNINELKTNSNEDDKNLIDRRCYTFNAHINKYGNNKNKYFNVLNGKEIDKSLHSILKSNPCLYFKVNIDNKQSIYQNFDQKIIELAIKVFKTYITDNYINMILLIATFMLPDTKIELPDIVNMPDKSAVSFYNKRAKELNLPYCTETNQQEFTKNSFEFLNEFASGVNLKYSKFIESIKDIHENAHKNAKIVKDKYHSSLIKLFSTVTQNYINKLTYSYFSSKQNLIKLKLNTNFESSKYSSVKIIQPNFNFLQYGKNKILSSKIDPINDEPKIEPKNIIMNQFLIAPIEDPTSPVLSLTNLSFSVNCYLTIKNLAINNEKVVLHIYSNCIEIISENIKIGDENENIEYVKRVDMVNIKHVLKMPINSIEIFSVNDESFFLTFCNLSNEIIRKEIIRYVPSLNDNTDFGINEKAEINAIIQKWVNNQNISVFDLLLSANIFSGRSFNNENNYIIMPNIYKENITNDVELIPFNLTAYEIDKPPIKELVSFETEFLPQFFYEPQFIENTNNDCNLFEDNEFIYSNRKKLETYKPLSLWFKKAFEIDLPKRSIDYTLDNENTISFINNTKAPANPKVDQSNNDKYLVKKFKFFIDSVLNCQIYHDKWKFVTKNGNYTSFDIDFGEFLTNPTDNRILINENNENNFFNNKSTENDESVISSFFIPSTEENTHVHFIDENSFIQYTRSSGTLLFEKGLSSPKFILQEKGLIKEIISDGDLVCFVDINGFANIYSKDNFNKNIMKIMDCQLIAISKSHHMAVVLTTNDSSLIYYSLNDKCFIKKYDIFHSNDQTNNFTHFPLSSSNMIVDSSSSKIHKIEITPSFGFILLYCEEKINQNETNMENKYMLKLLNVKGEYLCEKKIAQRLIKWSCLKSKKGIDYVCLADEKGDVYLYEVFGFRKEIFIGNVKGKIVLLKYSKVYSCIVLINEDGEVSMIPINFQI